MQQVGVEPSFREQHDRSHDEPTEPSRLTLPTVFPTLSMTTHSHITCAFRQLGTRTPSHVAGWQPLISRNEHVATSQFILPFPCLTQLRPPPSTHCLALPCLVRPGPVSPPPAVASNEAILPSPSARPRTPMNKATNAPRQGRTTNRDQRRRGKGAGRVRRNKRTRGPEKRPGKYSMPPLVAILNK